MSNHLKKEKQINALHLLCESNSISGVCRLLRIDKGTVLRLLVRFGNAALHFLNKRMQNLSLECLEIDEMWTWVAKKEKNLTEDEKRNPELGSQYIYYAMDRHTKLIPYFLIGKRNEKTTRDFMVNLAGRLSSKTQISTDGWQSYPESVENAFGGNVNYGWTIKDVTTTDPPKRQKLVGDFDADTISTSKIERCNGTLRNFVRRCHRRTYCFPKKFDNLQYAIALHIMYYNFVRVHKSLNCTPAMRAKIVPRLWKFEDMFETLCKNMYQ